MQTVVPEEVNNLFFERTFGNFSKLPPKINLWRDFCRNLKINYFINVWMKPGNLEGISYVISVDILGTFENFDRSFEEMHTN